MIGSNRHFDYLAGLYDRVIGRPDPEIYIQLMELTSDHILIDAGGGTGRIIHTLLPSVKLGMVVDVSEGMLRQARQKGLLAIRSIVEKLPFPHRSVDRILVSDAFHHFINQQKALVEFFRVLKPGGRLLIEEPDFNRFPVKIVSVLEKLALMRSQFRSPETICEWMKDIGFDTSVTTGTLFRSYILGIKP